MTRKCNVLLVDDDENDRLLFGSALKATGLDIELIETPDGYAAINYLLSAEPAEFPFPDVVFLDLKMPGMDGFAVLKEIRSRPELKRLTVYILSHSNQKSDMVTAHALGANAAYYKPSHYKDLVGLLQTVLTPWCQRTPGAPKRKTKET
jgi:two-component system, response regulator